MLLGKTLYYSLPAPRKCRWTRSFVCYPSRKAIYAFSLIYAVGHNMFLDIKMSVLLENTPGGVFSISTLVKISMTSLISSLTVKLFLYLFVSERWYIINTSWGMPRKSSANLRLSNLWTFLESIRKCSCALRTIFGESSEIFRQWLKIFGKSSKTLSVCL